MLYYILTFNQEIPCPQGMITDFVQWFFNDTLKNH